ncbi:MAG: hypothetical protein PVSMB9_05410 [Candidatus Dormibacteria bacterium]
MDATTILAIIASAVVFGAWSVLPHSGVQPQVERIEVPEPGPVSLSA